MGGEKDIYFIPLFIPEMIRIKREICVKDTERSCWWKYRREIKGVRKGFGYD